MDTRRFNKQLDFIREIDKVKSIFRNTVLLDKSRRENDAEHSWHMAVCAMLFQEYANDKNLDMCKTLKMIMLHDIIEIYSGDTFAYDPIGRETQSEREKLAADKLFALLPADQKMSLERYGMNLKNIPRQNQNMHILWIHSCQFIITTLLKV